MKSDVVIDSVLPFWPTLGVALLTVAVLIGVEIRRKNSYLAIRVVCHVLIVVSLIVLLLRPSYLTEKKLNGSVLVTKGFDQKKLDSLHNFFSLQVIQAPDVSQKVTANAVALGSWHELAPHAPSVKYVIGEGLPAYVFNENPKLSYSFLPSRLPQGITSVDIQPLKAGLRQFVHGTFHSQSENLVLKLVGPAGAEDSVRLDKQGVIPFSLEINPRTDGKFIYQMIVSQEGKMVSSENLPVEVLPQERLNVLFLQQHPVFETRYLKNFLGDQGHAVTLRYQVSKNTLRHEYLNAENKPITSITKSVLESYDLVVTTVDALEKLNRGEVQSLVQSANGGLGVLILFNDVGGTITREFFNSFLEKIQADTTSFRLPFGGEPFTLPAIGLRLKNSPGMKALIEDNRQRALSGYFYRQAGKVGFQFLTETYRLALEGRSDEYGRIWSPLVEDVARRKSDEFKIIIRSPFPYYADEPVDIDVVAAEKMPLLSFNGFQVPLIEDTGIDNLWHGAVWPDGAGWQKLTLQDSTSANFFITDNDQWTALRVARQSAENSTREETEFNEASQSFYQPVSLLFFLVLFILASGTLWLVAKI